MLPFTKSLQFQWTNFQQVLHHDETSFQILNETVRKKFLPSLFGNNVTEGEADLSSLPVDKERT